MFVRMVSLMRWRASGAAIWGKAVSRRLMRSEEPFLHETLQMTPTDHGAGLPDCLIVAQVEDAPRWLRADK
jgi:hypothetical protein